MLVSPIWKLERSFDARLTLVMPGLLEGHFRRVLRSTQSSLETRGQWVSETWHALPFMFRTQNRAIPAIEDFKPPVSEHVAKFLAQRPTSEYSNFSIEGAEQSDEAFDDSPMDWDDYGLIDELTPDAIDQIDAALRSLAAAKPKKVAAIIGRVMAHSPARVPGLPDYFYLERVRLLVESGVLRLVGDIEDPMKGEVYLPS
jgi:hypothetical protein